MRKVIEEFEGVLDHVDGHLVYTTLYQDGKPVCYIDQPVEKLNHANAPAQRKFKLKVVDTGSAVVFDIEPIPDCVVSNERCHETDRILDVVFPEEQ